MHKVMKTFYTSNSDLMELLTENGFNLICDEQMRVIISNKDAEKIPAFVEEFAPSARMDYTIEDL